MHIPDGFLSMPVWLGLNAAAAPAVGYLARRSQRRLEEASIPLLGTMGAFVFAAQMINFPVAPGTSGHLIGGALLAITLGPAAAGVVMTAILAVQALVFQDGGILALGANVFNMALAGVLAGYAPFYFLGAGSWRRPAIFLGGLLSVMVSALLAMAQLLLSGVQISGAVLGLSLGVFLISGVLEGAITLAVAGALESLKPGLARAGGGPKGNRLAASLGVTAVLLAVVGVMFASAHPDGLEKLAENLGIAGRAQALLASPVADYEAAFAGSLWVSRATAGLLGLTLIFGLSLVLGRWMARRGRRRGRQIAAGRSA